MIATEAGFNSLAGTSLGKNVSQSDFTMSSLQSDSQNVPSKWGYISSVTEVCAVLWKLVIVYMVVYHGVATS